MKAKRSKTLFDVVRSTRADMHTVLPGPITCTWRHESKVAACMHPQCTSATGPCTRSARAPLCRLPECAADLPPPPAPHTQTNTNTHRCLHPPHAQCALQLLRHGGITPVGKLKSLLERRPDVFLVCRCVGPGGCSPCLTASAHVFVRPTCHWPRSCCAVHPFSGVCVCVAVVHGASTPKQHACVSHLSIRLSILCFLGGGTPLPCDP